MRRLARYIGEEGDEREIEREEGGKTARYSALTSKPAVARRTFPGIMLHEQINRRVRLTLVSGKPPIHRLHSAVKPG